MGPVQRETKRERDGESDTEKKTEWDSAEIEGEGAVHKKRF